MNYLYAVIANDIRGSHVSVNDCVEVATPANEFSNFEESALSRERTERVQIRRQFHVFQITLKN